MAHYNSLVAGVRKHLPAGEFESLAGELKTKRRADLWTDNQNLALARIVKNVEDGPADCRSTGRFWASVQAAMEIEKVRPGTKASALSAHYYALVAGVRKHLPAGEFESLAGELKTPWSRADLWTDNQNLALARIVKNVEDGPADGRSTVLSAFHS